MRSLLNCCKVFFAIAIAIATLLSFSTAAPMCATSGLRAGCSQTKTFPCSWTNVQCEFQYDFMRFDCLAVPANQNMSVSVSCSPTDSNKAYTTRVFDSTSSEKFLMYSPNYSCENEGCEDEVTGDFDWSNVVSNTTDAENGYYSLFIGMVDYNTCLDITCDVEFVLV